MENSFRENLRAELDYQGITVKELSAKTGIPKPTLDCYLSNRRTIPPVDAAVKIARALHSSAEQLVFGNDSHESESQKTENFHYKRLLENFKKLPPTFQKTIETMIISTVNNFQE